MVSTFTPNIQIEEPARGDDVGTWDTPVNNNSTLIDLVAGGNASITLNNANIQLSAAQFQSNLITFVSTLTGNVSITFPTSFKKPYSVQNLCTGSSAFNITLQTTASGGQVIGVPFGQVIDVFNDGSNIKFRNLAPVGSYVDYGGGGMPGWVGICTVPPYLDCNGQSFSSTTYPVLALILNATTVPDFRGRAPYYLNEGTGRLTSGGAGINGDVNFATGGSNGVTLIAAQIPSLSGSNSITVNPSGNSALFAAVATQVSPTTVQAPTGTATVPQTNNTWSGVTNFSGTNTITVNGGSPNNIVGATAPGCVAGLRMIRAG